MGCVRAQPVGTTPGPSGGLEFTPRGTRGVCAAEDGVGLAILGPPGNPLPAACQHSTRALGWWCSACWHGLPCRMGNFLDTPITEKETEVGQNSRLAYGLSAMQGWRAQMEDDHVQLLGLPDVRAAHGTLATRARVLAQERLRPEHISR